MTKNQRITLMADYWPKACQAQGWKKDDRDKRLEVCSKAVGRKLESTNELNTAADFGKVKNYLKMLCDNVKATIETDHPEIDQARRFCWVILNVLIPCLRIYIGNADAYMAEIIKDKFKRGSRAMPLALDDLNAAQLEQLVMTLQRAANSHRQENGETVHQMKTRAGVKCDCAACSKKGRPVFHMPAPEPEPEPVLAENQPF